MTAKECLVEFKKNYCEKNPEYNGDPDFGSKNVKEDK